MYNDPMELQDFIAKTLKEIAAGITQGSTGAVKFRLGTDRQRGVNFDVAVTTTTGGQSKRDGGIHIKVLELGAGKLKKEEQRRVHRIQFTVTLDRPKSVILSARPLKR